MTALEQLHDYLRKLRLRLQLLTLSRSATFVAAFALLLTFLLASRTALFITLAAAFAAALVPLFRLNVTQLVERRIPGLEQRLLTITERGDKNNPFTELLAEETLGIARSADDLAPATAFLPWVGATATALAALLWVIAASPTANSLWTGKKLSFDIAVTPGNRTIRRHTDQTITAKLLNFSARRVTLHARYGNGTKWEEVSMQPQRSSNGYQFLFAGLSDPVEYYVQADTAQSKHFAIGVKDLPVVQRLRVQIHFPEGLGLKDEVDDPGGDIRAVVGSTAKIGVFTSRNLENGALILENGSQIPLDSQGSATLKVAQNGSYHVASIENGEPIRISDDFFIDGKNDDPPSVKILRPGADPHVSPIEEVPVVVEASDDFGLNGMDLHYSVNGGADQVISLLKAKGERSASGSALLSLENFKLVPGDVVSMYATARDANTTSQSDIVFAQAEPFDYTFRQAQQAGGGMGGGDQEDRISDRQKEIIAATWNQTRANGNKDKGSVTETAKFLAGTEGKLGDQAKSLADRMGSREMAGASPQFEAFSKLMTEASNEMNDAVGSLKPGQWRDALGPEQKALQSLLRAEAIFRDIQVAYGQSGNGMGGGSGTQRDLARMFDLELDTTKNQYETSQSQQSSGGDQQKKVDEALQRLKDLAKRQQELASQPQQQAQAMQQRWEEEQLRRDAEELRREMQQQQNQSGQTGQAMQNAMQALQKAEDEMRKAVSERDATAQQRAGEQLAQAENALRNSLHQQAGDSVKEMSQQAQQIADAQRDLAKRIKGMYGAQDEPSASPDGMPQMPDPERRQFGYGWRRSLPDPGPQRPATQSEKAAAAEKDKLAERVQRLEKQMEDQARAMAGEQPDAASKLRKALSDAEQEELALRMQKNAQWMRQGYGERTYSMEDSVTAGLDQLSRQLQETQSALKSGENGQQSADNKAAQTLAQLRALREQLQQQQQSGANNQDVRNAIQQLSGMMTNRGGSYDRQLNGYIDSALGALRNYANGQQGVLEARVNQDAVTSLERLEIELGKRIGEQRAEGTRMGAKENAPEGYRDAVAEYFRKLSR